MLPPTRTSLRAAFAFAAVTIVGCGHSLPPGQRVTDVDPITATPDYWWEKPCPAKVELPDFDRAVAAVQSTMRSRFFVIDRFDLREGVITSVPLVSAQWFEPWRDDVSTVGDVARSSLGTYRRTIRFDITRTPAGRYLVTPRVLVERETTIGRRVTSGIVGFGTFSVVDESSVYARAEDGQPAPGIYWYATQRDYNLEAALVEDVVARAY